ncbi:SDR family NAD(P)-dependent oxidoreductase [Marispirochaeta sp.]|uniref:SDR family NAD(P)-dependent oxidoreductase n=1 Tax=Marispirochaeta sp. TaxID=2038653 RepID=UPI0029C922AE|nr:SDR family NAD(P)-dependent oxidoreductase [Marispirochaeta sp.]
MDKKVAIITGGGTGIGRSTALMLAERGVACVVNYSRSKEDAEKTVADIQAAGGYAVSFCASVAEEKAVAEMVAATFERFGRIDYLVNNAGKTEFIPLEDLDAVKDEDWDSIFDVNIKGTFKVSRACAGELKKTGGAIVNVSSIASRGAGSSIPYCVSKGGIDTLTRSLAKVLAPDVRVNAVAPGIVTTRWVAGKEDHIEKMSEGTPLKKVCGPDDVAQVIVSLLCQADLMTGQIVTIDGGLTM